MLVQAGPQALARARKVRFIVPAAVRYPLPLAALGAALMAGALAAYFPQMALGALAVVLLLVLALRAPVAHLLLLVTVAVLLPGEIQTQFSLSGGLGSPGLTDALILTGGVRVAFELMHHRLEARRLAVVGALLAFLLFAVVQLWHGTRSSTLANAMSEFHPLLGMATALLALPLLAREDQRRRLMRGLVVIGLAVGVWGIAQWVLGLRFDGAGPVVSGLRFSTGGKTVGLYAFPVAAILGVAVLTSGYVRGRRSSAALFAVVALNLVALAFTFERTFWVTLAAGIVYLLVRSPGPQRVRLLAAVPVLVVALTMGLAAVAPAELNALTERLSSVTNYQRDESVSYRQAEGQLVWTHIRAHPVVGSGLGANMLIGRPGTTVQPKPRMYAESGYLWLAWKVGLPIAGLLCAVLLFGAVSHLGRSPSLFRAVRTGSQAALVTLGVTAVSWNIFDSIVGTTVLGLLLALAVTPPARRSGP